MPKKVLLFAGPFHPIPPLKGAAVEKNFSWNIIAENTEIFYELLLC